MTGRTLADQMGGSCIDCGEPAAPGLDGLQFCSPCLALAVTIVGSGQARADQLAAADHPPQGERLRRLGLHAAGKHCPACGTTRYPHTVHPS
ncbi:hypothetical protein [Gordonia sp. (in: high G+C Gram-positive bacteria)]|uniref:hypothetical protein n=1 Tax=Gordonia sp. (in: high G+C Gram-positive bacteria) TaxID=84139 RepID=UPI0033428B2A